MNAMWRKLLRFLQSEPNGAQKTKRERVLEGTDKAVKEYKRTFDRLVEYDRTHQES